MRKLRWKIAQSAEIRWWQRYLKRKPISDYLHWKKAYWKTLLHQIGVTVRDEEKVLDAGCGPAGIFTILDNQQVDAVDPLLNQYDEKLDHFQKDNYPNVSFFSESLEDFQSTKKYDKVFCLNAINHVADLAVCFEKLVQLTRSGGQLIVSIDAHNYQLFKSIFRLLPGDILHPHQYDLREYKKMLIDRDVLISNVVLYKKQFLFNYYVLVCSKGEEEKEVFN
jgi:2-polyprenyl-6-hydroxyphenyl methylase/3-demethylubiquinone-9 3-methyltransferase